MRNLKQIFLFFFSAILFLSPIFVFAQTSLQNGCKLDPKTGQEICSLENPLAGNKVEAAAIISTAIKAALGIVGALTLLMLVWGGFQWLTSAGNPEKVKMGTQTMVWAIIGVALVFASYLLLSTFTSYLTGGTT